MSLIKSVTTELNGHPISVNLPDKKTIILSGRNNMQIMYIVESLLSNDFTDYYRNLDKSYGYNYEEPTGTSQLLFNNGAIYGRDKKVGLQGTIPKVHCIKYLGSSNKLRSFCLSDDCNYSQIYTDMTKYSGVIPEAQWVRLTVLVNSVIGHDVVFFDGDELTFKFLEDIDISVDGQRLIYMLIAECFLTPKGYHRVLLLPDIECLPIKVQLKLLETLDNIIGHTLTLSTAKVSLSDLSSTNAVTYINV